MIEELQEIRAKANPITSDGRRTDKSVAFLSDDGIYDPKAVRAKHRRVAQLIAMGYKNTAIAGILQCTPQNISDIRNSPMIQSLVHEIQSGQDEQAKTIADEITRMQPKALAVLEEVIDDLDDQCGYSLRSKVAMHMLALGGHSPVKKVDVNQTNINLSKTQIELIRQRATETKLFEE